MELSAETLGMLRDEAYLYLCREAVEDRLAVIEQDKAAIANSRPPFSGFTHKIRDALAASMRTTLDDEAALHERMVKIVRLEGWLQPLLRRDITAYLHVASAHFQRFPQIHTLLNEWELSLPALRETLVGFTRDLRTVRVEAAAGRRLTPAAAAALHELANRLEQQFLELARKGAAIVEHALHLNAEEVRLPVLPNLLRVAWVRRLGVMPLGLVAPEIAQVEAELRALVIGGIETAVARVRATRELIAILQDGYVEHYWNQLRTHARIHYVEERDLDAVLESLNQAYAAATAAQPKEFKT